MGAGCCPHWTLAADGAAACEDILADVFGMTTTTKDDRNILTRRGFETVLRSITRELLLITRPEDEKALRLCLRALDNNWAGLSPHQIEEAISTAAQALGGVPRVALSPITSLLTRMGQQIVVGAKEGAKSLYDLPISGAFDVVDERVIGHAATSQALFVRDEYGKRVALASQAARDVVSRGLEQGLDRHAIGEQLGARMTAIGVRRSEAYFENVASIFGARARSWGVLSGFDEAGIERFQVSETLDAVSCNVCRLMDGQVFSVQSARQRYLRVAESTDPEDVKRLQPFLGVAQGPEGEQAIYFKRGEEKVSVARVVESGVGRDDDRGRYEKVMPAAQMEANGVQAPPYHGRCRGLITPA